MGTVPQRLAAAFQVALSAIAFGVPILYVMGRVYAEALWSELHLPSSLMQYSVQDYMYLAFTGLLNAAARMFASLGLGTFRYVLTTAAALALIATYIVALDKWFAPTIKRRLRAIDTKLTSWESDRNGWWINVARLAMAFWFAATTMTLFLFAAFFVVLLPLVVMHEAGTTQATIERQRLSAIGTSSNDKRPVPILRYREAGGTAKAALLVQCSSQWCFVYEAGAFGAVPMEDVIRIDHCPRHSELRKGSPVCLGSAAGHAPAVRSVSDHTGQGD